MPHDWPKWDAFVSGFLFFTFLIMNIQTCFIIYAMVATKSFTLGTKTALGMWKFDTITIHSVASFVYSISPLSAQEFLSEIKFTFIFSANWCKFSNRAVLPNFPHPCGLNYEH
ncbi:hypothetical protein O181_034415 [Austropuccinia psidii MF-1]|uniref:Uncharacterized protein n=1 Tax=Austropuccinia psidii MF-1 TaxID=1389203 RepID=A0A9Q3D2Z8_9BASI|nr:hypothetical protein [Austropuccinia psidii MF-1]